MGCSYAASNPRNTAIIGVMNCGGKVERSSEAMLIQWALDLATLESAGHRSRPAHH